jgi:predicted O-methyltransferase YrrM
MDFTNTWHNGRRYLWKPLLADYYNRSNVKYLEIGTYEGNSLVWMFENILTDINSSAHVIDTFEGSVEHTELEIRDVKKRFDKNTTLYKNKLTTHVGYSFNELVKLCSDLKFRNYFDLIYIDASHQAHDVLSDAVLSFSLLKVNGIMIFDDYDLKTEPNNTELGVNCFLGAFSNKIKIIKICEQVFIRKISD